MLRYKNYIFFLLLIFSFNISSSQVIWRDSTGYIADTVYVDTTAFNLYGPFQYAKPTTASFLYLAPTFPNLSVPGWNNAIHNYQDKSFPYQSSPPYFNYNGVLYNPYDSRIFTDSLYGKLIGKLPENFLNGEVWIGAPVLNKPIYYRGSNGVGSVLKWKYAFFPYYKFPLYRNEDTVGVVFPDSLFFGGGISDSSVVADVIKINDTTLQVKRKAHIYNKGHYIRRTRLDSFLVSLSSSYYTYNNYYFDTTINNNYYNVDTNYYISNYYIDTNYYYTIYNIDTNIYIYQIDTNIYVTNNYYTANPDTFVTGIYAYMENDSLKIEITRSQGAPMLFTSTKIEQMKKHGINDTTWHTGYPLNIWNGGTNFNAYDPYTHFQMLMKYDQETQQIKPTDILARDTWVKNGQSINYYTKNGYWRMYGATAGDLLRFDYYNDYGIFFTPDNMIGCNGLHIFDWSKNYCGGIYADTSALSIDVNRYKYIFNYGKISNVRPAEANGEVVVFEQLPNVSGLDTSVRIVESIKVGSDTSIYYTSSIYTFRTGLLKKITPLLPDTIIRAPGNEISTPPKRLAWSNIIPNKKEYYMGYVYLMGDCEECNKTLISKTPTTSIKIRLDNIGQESGHYRVYIDSVIEGKTVIKGFDKSGVLFDGTEQEFNVELKDPEIIDINGQSKDLTNGGPLAYYLKGYVIDSTTQNGIQITDFKVYISTKKSNTTTPPIIPPTTGGWGGTDDDYYYSMPYSFWLGFASKKYTGEGLSGGDLDPEYFDENCEGWIVKWKAHTVFPSSSSSPGYGSDCNADNLWVTVDDEEAPMNDFTDPVDLCFIKAIKPAIKFGSSCMRLEVWFIHNEIPYSAFNVIYYPNQSNYKISNQTPDNGIPTEPEQIDTVKMIKHLINDTTWHFGFPLTVEHGGTNNTNFSNTIDNQTYNFIAYDPTNNRFIRTPYNYSNIVQASSDTVIAIIDTNVIATKFYVDSVSSKIKTDSIKFATKFYVDSLLSKIDTTKIYTDSTLALKLDSLSLVVDSMHIAIDTIKNKTFSLPNGVAGQVWKMLNDSTQGWGSDLQSTGTADSVTFATVYRTDTIKANLRNEISIKLARSDSNTYYYRPWKIQNILDNNYVTRYNPDIFGTLYFSNALQTSYFTMSIDEIVPGTFNLTINNPSYIKLGNDTLSTREYVRNYFSGNLSKADSNIYFYTPYKIGYLYEPKFSILSIAKGGTGNTGFTNGKLIEYGWSEARGDYVLKSSTYSTSDFALANHTHSNYLTSESDPIFTSSAAYGITSTNINNWNTAYSWGNHATAGYATQSWVGNNYSPLGHTHSGYLTSESDPIFTNSAAYGITSTNINNWNTAYGWGNHASAGYATQTWVSSNYSAIGHTHSGYISTGGAYNDLYSSSKIGSGSGQVAAGDHTHSGYAPTFTVSSPLTYGSNVIGINQAGSSTSGYLSSTDWNTFNNKASTGWVTEWVSSNFAPLSHSHDGTYLGLSGGTLSGPLYAPYLYMGGNLVATQSWVSGGYSPLGHTHSGYATESWVTNNFSSTSHNHSGVYEPAFSLLSLSKGGTNFDGWSDASNRAVVMYNSLHNRIQYSWVTVPDESGELATKGWVQGQGYITSGVTGSGSSGTLAIWNGSTSLTYNSNASTTGSITANGLYSTADVIAYYSSSDIRLKDSIKTLTNATEKLKEIRGVEFIWNKNDYRYGQKDIGVIAQELQKIIPTAVVDRGDGYLAVHLEKIVPLLIESNKELEQRISKLEELVKLLLEKTK